MNDTTTDWIQVARKGGSTVIGAVSASVTAPTAGKTPSDVAPTITSADTTLYDYDWFVDGSAMSKWTETFEGGKTYTLKIRASTTSAFTSSTTATINGSPATVQSWDEHSILFYQDFTIASTPAALSTVGITVTAPEVGKAPSYNANLDPSTLTIANRQMGSSEYALFFEGITEREYAKRIGSAPMTIHNRKVRIQGKLKKLMEK